MAGDPHACIVTTPIVDPRHSEVSIELALVAYVDFQRGDLVALSSQLPG
ncbi:hypothetical protein FOPG_10034 [Fusarium oxysporum f. sp. conglutinans race 2 54008]|uniref:Uncharacterized protein n=1 Tax=Fusarium oxysporum f. sp. conglutinans race 2 54008 TaxID=1089457 RepID=X0HSU2_FUSOX|nr:hypothetical protein FOPG_10034 [Fusarium oxysporum f. sp. conglutinans race 2 54008]